VPIAALARPVSGGLEIDGLVASPDGRSVVREHVFADARTAAEAAAVLAGRILARGAGRILEEFRA
jgi:porphobilinogen deaminase